MLQKNEGFKVDPDDPFRDDKLDRDVPAQNLTKLVQSITQPFVLSVNAPWGRGKTKFVEMWMAHLKKEGTPCIYFNAWENDFSSEPLVSFIGEFRASLDSLIEKDSARKKAEKALEKVKSLGAAVVKTSLSSAVRYATSNIIDPDKIKEEMAEGVEKYVEEKIENYKGEKETIISFKKSLEEFAGEITSDGSEYKLPLVVFVDELDRCRPTYAVELLERIKHLFSVPGVVFVLSVSREQLGHSICSLYGSGMDSDNYLKRFIDLEYTLPDPPKDGFCVALGERFKLQEIYPEFIGMELRNNVDSSMSDLSGIIPLSLRDIEQSYTIINAVVRIAGRLSETAISVLCFLVSIKVFDKNKYYGLIDGSINIKDVISDIKKLRINPKYWRSNDGVFLEAISLCGMLDSADFKQEERALRDKMANPDVPSEKSEAEALHQRISVIANTPSDHGTPRELFDFLIKKIEYSEPFA